MRWGKGITCAGYSACELKRERKKNWAAGECRRELKTGSFMVAAARRPILLSFSDHPER